MAELVEGARLLSECSEKSEPWVRIPLSPLFYSADTIYHSLFPTISVFCNEGEFWFAPDKDNMEIRCPDYFNDVRGTLKRECVGELQLPPEVLAKLEEIKGKKK
jgi:hypothetical protein